VIDPGDGLAVVSSSPERFLHRAPGSDRLETRPIKGTRRRAGRPDEDARLAADLAADPKERAEHLMIVDLERNDLGRVARTGSVAVDSFARVVELPTVLHLVSTVSCLTGAGAADILRATFPGGSITGAPKRRAMQIIDELEPFRRGVYTGAIGYLGQGGAIDLSIAIRTAVVSPSHLTVGVGGGVVADSTLGRELEETEEKAAAWRAILG
jgi:anthranilate/para-aminobenzoate synthase component I